MTNANATITERGNGLPDPGDYVPGDDGELYVVVSLDGQIQTGGASEGNWVRATLELADWHDIAEDDDVFPASATLGDDEVAS